MIRKIGPNTVASDEGWQVEVLGRTGLRYIEGGKIMLIESEILLGPAGMAVYASSARAWLPPNDLEPIDDGIRARIIENIRRAFKFEGFDIDIF